MPRYERRTPGAKYAGGHRSRVTPVPIPNTEVKPATADGTAWETVWESRSLPALSREEANMLRHVGLSVSTPATTEQTTQFHMAPIGGTAERAAISGEQ